MPISIIATRTEHGIETRMDEEDLFVIVKKCVERGLTWSDLAKLMKDGWELKVIKI